VGREIGVLNSGVKDLHVPREKQQRADGIERGSGGRTLAEFPVVVHRNRGCQEADTKGRPISRK